MPRPFSSPLSAAVGLTPEVLSQYAAVVGTLGAGGLQVNLPALQDAVARGIGAETVLPLVCLVSHCLLQSLT